MGLVQQLSPTSAFLRKLLVWKLLLAGGSLPVLAAPTNIVLITIDTVRADRMGFLGSSAGLTPNLDDLARQGVVFSKGDRIRAFGSRIRSNPGISRYAPTQSRPLPRKPDVRAPTRHARESESGTSILADSGEASAALARCAEVPRQCLYRIGRRRECSSRTRRSGTPEALRQAAVKIGRARPFSERSFTACLPFDLYSRTQEYRCPSPSNLFP
jgi:hypothetical protein